MRRAIKQQNEDLCEKSRSHFTTVTGRNAIETLERQDDRQETNQTEDKHMLKVQLDSSEECEEHLETQTQAVIERSDEEKEDDEKQRKKQKKSKEKRKGRRCL